MYHLDFPKHRGVSKLHSGVMGGTLEVLKLVKKVAFALGLGRSVSPVFRFSRAVTVESELSVVFHGVFLQTQH